MQIIHNGAHHWLLLSSLKGKVVIYDSLNTDPTECLLTQLKYFFSPDNTLQQYEQAMCYNV